MSALQTYNPVTRYRPQDTNGVRQTAEGRPQDTNEVSQTAEGRPQDTNEVS